MGPPIGRHHAFLEDPTSPAARQVVDDVRAACISTGFFRMTGHGVPASLQQSVFDAAAKFFKLPQEVKTNLNAKGNLGFRGYDPMPPCCTKIMCFLT